MDISRKGDGTAYDPMAPKGLRAPRAAAIAGIVFSLLIGTSIVLIRLSLPSDPAEAGAWLSDGGRRTSVVVAANLIPFAGIAFLWFIGVIRNRLGDREDRFFATVFLGSGLLFIAMLFAAAAMAFGLLASFEWAPVTDMEKDLWDLGSKATLALLNVFSMRMAAVFVISTCTIAIRTAVIYRWIAYLGFPIALVLLLVGGSVPYVALLFPLWILLVPGHPGKQPARGTRSQQGAGCIGRSPAGSAGPAPSGPGGRGAFSGTARAAFRSV